MITRKCSIFLYLHLEKNVGLTNTSHVFDGQGKLNKVVRSDQSS